MSARNENEDFEQYRDRIFKEKLMERVRQLGVFISIHRGTNRKERRELSNRSRHFGNHSQYH
jgi:hypothetical protein